MVGERVRRGSADLDGPRRSAAFRQSVAEAAGDECAPRAAVLRPSYSWILDSLIR